MTMTSACIGWLADPPCPEHGDFHGCVHIDEHMGDHVCGCGARARGPRRRRRLTSAGESHRTMSDAPGRLEQLGTHWRGKGWTG